MTHSRHRRLWPGLLLMVALAVVSCNRKAVYSHYRHTPINGWEKNDTLTFDVRPLTEDAALREEVGLRINDAYPFMGLCLIVEQTVFPSCSRRTDTLNCSLIDPSGNVKGRGISYYQYNFHLTSQQLYAGDSLHICVRHNMKREILPGIADIGILLEKQ